jgi:AcrR family transcriptional regulator
MTGRIRDGVFFHVPVVLPRGRHELTREQVVGAQRERLMIAMTELMADRGYQRVGVREITARASVSRGAFYDCFADKEACVFAAYDRFIDVLLQRLAESVQHAHGWEAFVLGIVEVYLGTLQQDLVVGRAFQVEMDAVGPEARQRRRQALVGLAQFIRTERERLWPSERAPVPLSAYIGAVYAVRQIACDALDEEANPDLLSLAPELATWAGEMMRGLPPARPASRRVRRSAGAEQPS